VYVAIVAETGLLSIRWAADVESRGVFLDVVLDGE